MLSALLPFLSHPTARAIVMIVLCAAVTGFFETPH
ncbi:hypothetical protein SAMN05216176_102636 [Nitratireductor indicus]|nr:hypothetical protein SAMN05216176_102636 [Nitratireductor indicus]